MVELLADFLAFAATFISGATPRWVDGQPDARQRIYFANHSSHFDFLVLWGVLPPAVRAVTRPMAAKDYWEAGRLRNYLATQVFHAVLIERMNVSLSNNPLDIALEAMGNRCSLIIFPEGTRGTGEEVSPFKSGLYHLARKRPDVELVPVYLENLNRVLPKGEALPVPLLSSVTFGLPIHILEKEPRDAFLARARESVLNLKAE